MDKKEVFVYTEQEIEDLKGEAMEIIEHLSPDLKRALIVIHFLKKIIEDETGVKLEGINIGFQKQH